MNDYIQMLILQYMQIITLRLYLGYRYRSPIYGSIIFAEGEWVKSNA